MHKKKFQKQSPQRHKGAKKHKRIQFAFPLCFFVFFIPCGNLFDQSIVFFFFIFTIPSPFSSIVLDRWHKSVMIFIIV
jgi:hypothetical protein